MAKGWSAFVVALALLGCLVGTEVVAQDLYKPATPDHQYQPKPPVYTPPQPQAPQYQPKPQVYSPPQPQAPQYPSKPQVQPPPQPQAPQYPSKPQVQPHPQPQAPQYPSKPQVQQPPRPQVPQYPSKPQVQPHPQPQAPQYPSKPQVRPAPQTPSKFPQSTYLPKMQATKSAAWQPRGFYEQEPQAPNPQQPEQPQKPYEPQQPHQPQLPKQPPQPTPVFHSCEVADSQKIPCGSPAISAAGCEAISCCFDGQRCYFAKAVTIQCTKDAQFIVVVAREATLPNIDLEKISLLGQGQGCTHVDTNSAFAIYQFPVTACGSVVMEEPGVISYINRMFATYEIQHGDRGSITRDSHYDLLFECRYTGTSVETVVTEVQALTDPPLPVAGLGPVRVHLRLANGQCNTKGCNEVDAAYTSYYTEADYPVTKVLREPVYVEVQLLEKTDPLLVLTLGHCWTTTSPNPHSLPQWDILIDGCPYRDDRYLSSLVPVDSSSGLYFPSHYRRFVFKMFTFVDPTSMEPMREQVYIHCSTAICAAAPGRNCEPSCLRRKRDVEAAEEMTAEPKVVISVGPVIVTAPQQ
ncbi:zona pellucida sperm-binding protein 4 [Larimichthys crocea]|nr:zona pellucida sperm-binding protein 4 [Larimichthys crocea]